MKTFDFEKEWAALWMEVTTGMAEWRRQHPTATFREIETALDERMNRARAKFLTDAAMASQAADWSEVAEEARPVCPDCGAGVQSRGEKRRQLQTAGGEKVELRRHHAVCLQCGKTFFPPG